MPTSADVPVFDNWTALSFKRAMGSKSTPGASWAAPTWVGDHKRRLTAYMILQAYFDNSSRFFLYTKDGMTPEDHREYGDASLLRDTILAALVGDSQEIFVDGADQDLPDPQPDEDPDLAERRAAAEKATELQEWIRAWAWDKERFGLKIIETERNAVGLGDGVYVLGWDPRKNRVRLRVYDPGFYFPVLTDGNDDDFPERVHIAWEVETDDPTKRVIRRITWELAPIGIDESGALVTRRYPYASDVDSDLTCYMTDATWTLDVNRPNQPDDFNGATAVYETYVDEDGILREVNFADLGIDFLPVVHVPNTVSIQNHYGKSSVERVLQILDDLANADTDLQGASATTGKPPIALSGVTSAQRPTYQPGELWALGEKGSATMIDTSRSLDALIKYVEHLGDRLNVSARVPGAVLGQVKPSEVPSGIALALSFGPLISMIEEMRLVRSEKYPLLLQFVWRMSMVGGVEDVPQEWIPTRLEFGSYLPHDVSAVVALVKTLLEAKAISRKTAIRLLVAAGVDIEDAEQEVDDIAATDFDGAKSLADATGSEDAAAEYLGVEVESPPPAPPVPIIPPTPPTE